MKFALANGRREEAQPGLSGECPQCGNALVAKCGERRAQHWAHKGQRRCDPWWENETAWHRGWKDEFASAWQEVVQRADDGERHIADVKTAHGWVIEFQHSYITPDERRSRNAFYGRLIWVLNGHRRKRDATQFANAYSRGVTMGAFRRVLSEGCAMLEEWGDTSAPTLIDFGGDELWWLLGRAADGATYILRYSRAAFVETHRGATTDLVQQFDSFVAGIPKQISDGELFLRLQHQASRQMVLAPRRRSPRL
ncbi:MAG TPA: competence protein CoiA family protein [Gemmatimonadaceae bacterium]|jgi:hypothetical protein